MGLKAWMRGRFGSRVSGSHSTYPDPKEHCDICRWRLQCDARRRDDDHLCLVAGISKLQINELKKQGTNRTTALAGVALPLQWKSERGSTQTYERTREQARLQLEARVKGAPELGFGLTILPEPSAGDIFLDFEGDPYVGEGGFEYLLGYVIVDGDGASIHRAVVTLARR